MNPLALFLFILGGAGVMCFVTDPYFWLLHREIGDEVKKILTYYTLPQIVIGITTCILVVIIQLLFPVSLL
jgi:H+/gluconate symporter-like permease